MTQTNKTENTIKSFPLILKEHPTRIEDVPNPPSGAKHLILVKDLQVGMTVFQDDNNKVVTITGLSRGMISGHRHIELSDGSWSEFRLNDEIFTMESVEEFDVFDEVVA